MKQPTHRNACLAILAAVLVLASGARAQTDRTFEPVPLSHWAYRVVDQLASRGYSIGLPAGTFDGSRIVTRNDFATALSQLLKKLPERIGEPKGANDPMLPRLNELREDVAGVRRLLNEFTLDVALLGTSIEDARTTLAAIDGRLERLQGSQRAPRTASGYGFGAHLEPPLLDLGLEIAALGPSPGERLSQFALLPDGATVASISYAELEPLLHVRERPPLADPTANTSFNAQLSRNVGNYLVTAFYLREGMRIDRGAISSELIGIGPRAAVGGGVSRTFGDNIRLDVSGASYSSPYGDSFGDLLAFRGGVHYMLTRRWTVDAGVERLITPGLDRPDAQVYNVGFGRAFGDNMRLQVLYQYFNLIETPGSSGASPLSDGSAAVTRFMLKF